MAETPIANPPTWMAWAIALSPIVTAVLTTTLNAVLKPKYEDYISSRRERRGLNREADGRLFWLFTQTVSVPIGGEADKPFFLDHAALRDRLTAQEWGHWVDRKAYRLCSAFLKAAEPWRREIAAGISTAGSWRIATPDLPLKVREKHTEFTRYMRSYVGDPAQYAPEGSKR